MACMDMHTCIDKSEAKEHVLKSVSWAQAHYTQVRHQVISGKHDI